MDCKRNREITIHRSGHGKVLLHHRNATIGPIATLAKLGAHGNEITIHLGVAQVILFAAAIAGVALSIPVPRSLIGEADLFEEYAKTIRRIIFYSGLWVVLWVSGSPWGLFAVLR